MTPGQEFPIAGFYTDSSVRKKHPCPARRCGRYRRVLKPESTQGGSRSKRGEVRRIELQMTSKRRLDVDVFPPVHLHVDASEWWSRQQFARGPLVANWDPFSVI